MLQRLLTKILSSLFVLFAVSFAVFLLVHIIPGDPVEVMLGEHASQADRETLRANLGLDQPLLIQLGHYYQKLFMLDLGQSLFNKQPVASLIIERLPATLELTVAAMVLALLFAVPLGSIAAMQHRRRGDAIAGGIALFGLSVPNFVLGPVLMLLFAVWLGWLPVNGRDGLASLVLPAITLGTAMAAMLMRMLRSSMLEVLGEDYIRSARARGLSPARVLWRHVLRNAWLPVLTVIGLQLGALLAGAVITETVFSWPGIGQLTVDAIQKRDYPLLQGCVLFISVTYILVNTIVDLFYGLVDPRIRLQSP